MAIRICRQGEERQVLEIGAVPPDTIWFVHWTGPDSVYEMRRFAGLGNNFAAALHCAELVSMNAPKGDVWLADQPNFAPHRFGSFEPNPGAHCPEDLLARGANAAGASPTAVAPPMPPAPTGT